MSTQDLAACALFVLLAFSPFLMMATLDLITGRRLRRHHGLKVGVTVQCENVHGVIARMGLLDVTIQEREWDLIVLPWRQLRGCAVMEDQRATQPNNLGLFD